MVFFFFLIVFDHGSLTELFCSLVVLCSELFDGLFFWDLFLVSCGAGFYFHFFSSCRDLLRVSIFSVSCSFDSLRVFFLFGEERVEVGSLIGIFGLFI